VERRVARVIETRIKALAGSIDWLHDQAPFGTHTVAADGCYARINAVELGWLGYRADELVGLVRPIEHLTLDSAARFEARCRESRTLGFHALDLDMRTRGGRIIPVSLSVTGTEDLQGRPVSYRAVVIDRSPTVERAERHRFAALSFDGTTALCVMDETGRILEVNAAFAALVGLSGKALRSRTLAVLDPGADAGGHFSSLIRQVVERGLWQGEILCTDPDHGQRVLWGSVSRVAGERGGAGYCVGSFFEITANRASNAELNRVAFFDPLTQLPNRRLLYERVVQELATAQRTGICAALLFIDLDHFKAINDTRGHTVGDALLVEAGRRLRQLLRVNDTVARFGGDEFVVLLADLEAEPAEAAKDARRVGEKILAALAESYPLGEYQFTCTASIGISVLTGAEVVDEVLQHADLAMYQAKRAGRGRLRFFDEAMQEAVSARVTLEQALQGAMLQGQLELYYQPQVDHAGAIVGAEALLRWQHPTLGGVSPDRFVPVAEETGLLLPIGRWVLAEACARLACWRLQPAMRLLRLAVNVSGRQFSEIGFVDELADLFRTTGADPSRLTLELTETQIIDCPDVIPRMRALSKLGVRFALDDFGTGQSSLSRLADLPVHEIKIDRRFVQALGGDRAGELLVELIIGVARNLGLRLVAEGVETEAQRVFLERLQCPIWQGFLCSAAVSMETFARLVTERLTPNTAGGSPHRTH